MELGWRSGSRVGRVGEGAGGPTGARGCGSRCSCAGVLICADVPGKHTPRPGCRVFFLLLLVFLFLLFKKEGKPQAPGESATL